MEYLETELDKVNRRYRSKLVNIITIPPIYNITPEQIPRYFSGIFMEASDVGVWVMSMSNDRRGKLDFYYHDKIIKIEEAGSINIDELEPDQRDKIKQSIKKYEDNRKKEIESYNAKFDTPDIKDPNDHEGINSMLNKVQQMVLDNKKNNDNSPGDFLQKRERPQ